MRGDESSTKLEKRSQIFIETLSDVGLGTRDVVAKKTDNIPSFLEISF